MKQATKDLIRGIYDAIEEGEPDISTERLLQMTADEATRQLEREIDVSDVAEALAPEGL